MNHSSYNVCINDHCLDGKLSTGRLLNYSFTIDVSNAVGNYELVLSILQIDVDGKKFSKRWGRQQGSNLHGQSPIDFKSVCLITRRYQHLFDQKSIIGRGSLSK